MWLTPFLHLRCKAIFFTSLMTVLSWYNYDIKLTSCYRKVYEKNGYIMDKKELLKNTILSLDNDSFFELKTYFFKDFFGFYFLDDSEVTQGIFAEKLYDYFEKVELNNNKDFPNLLQKYMQSLDDKVSKYIFYLVEIEGKPQLDFLGITYEYYSNKKVAEKWHKEMVKLIHPDRCKHPKATEAMQALEKLYKGMI